MSALSQDASDSSAVVSVGSYSAGAPQSLRGPIKALRGMVTITDGGSDLPYPTVKFVLCLMRKN